MEKSYRPAEARDGPFISPTWLTKLITGEASCLWSLWFRARHEFDQLDSGFDLKSWTRDHDELVGWRAKKLREAGHRPRVEHAFKVEGRTATIRGKADISYESDETLWLEECKTGKRRDSDHVQVLIYIWLAELRGYSVAGARIIYRDAIEDVDKARLPEIREAALKLIKLATETAAPPRRPAVSECRSCNIGQYYCDERLSSGEDEIFVTDAF